LSITIWFQLKAKFYPQIPQRWKVSSLETFNKSSNFITNCSPVQAKILSSNHTQINIDHQRTNKENYYKCQPYLIVIGAGLDKISLLFERMEEKLNARVSSDTSFHLPLYSFHPSRIFMQTEMQFYLTTWPNISICIWKVLWLKNSVNCFWVKATWTALDCWQQCVSTALKINNNK